MSTAEAMDAPNACLGERLNGAREALVLAMLIYGLAQSGEAFAQDLSADILKDMQPLVGGKPLPKAFAPAAPSSEVESATADFHRREPAGLQPETVTPLDPFPSKNMQATSPWQRFADYRAQGRVQLLTLWDSPRTTVSLQAGKHGGPSLQWSSRVVNRAGATRGLLDRFVASSLGAARMHSKIEPRNPDTAGLTPSVK